jgi:glycolate oxidase iron-sulfur subunit
MKDMLENERKPTAEVVKHIDRCLSCLSCMTTCPSGVNYMHLVDHGRAYIEQNYQRGFWDRMQRALVANVLPYSARFRAAVALAAIARPLAGLFDSVAVLRPMAAMLRLAPEAVPVQTAASALPPTGEKGRVVVMQGCAEPVLSPQIRQATMRVLARCGYSVEIAKGEACCGALVHHMGREEEALAAARRNVDAWTREIERGLAAIIITTSGCGTTVKDYGFMLRGDPAYAAKAAAVSALTRDVSEFLVEAGLPGAAGRASGIAVAYHPACSMQHGQKITAQPKDLLAAAGFAVSIPAEAHLCCGSAGTYNIFQPEIAGRLGDRKAQAIGELGADVVATGNIGCAVQIGQRLDVPVVHTVELLDWATGGPVPPALTGHAKFASRETLA